MKYNNRVADRRKQPDVVIPDVVDIQKAAGYLSPNNVKIYSMPAAEYDVVRFSFVFSAGSSWQSVPFCASATVNNLAEGSADMSSQQIAEKLDYYGSYYDVTIDRDWSVVSFVCLTKFFKETLDIAKEILIKPLFPESELRVYCDKSRQNLIVNRTKMDFNARELFLRSLYGVGHPYGVSSEASLYDSLTRDDVVEFYRERYTSDNCFVVLSGNIDDDRIGRISEFVTELPSGAKREREVFPAAVSVPVATMYFPEAVQSAIRIGKVLFSREHPDFIGVQVAACVLGGYFGSRLIRNLREEHGYTYGAYSALVNFDHSGYFAIATEVGAEFTEAARNEIFNEITKLCEEPVPPYELALVKNIMIGEVMRILDGPFGIADVAIENIQNGMDNDYINRFVEEVNEITSERVMELARKYLDPKDMTTVVVGAAVEL